MNSPRLCITLHGGPAIPAVGHTIPITEMSGLVLRSGTTSAQFDLKRLSAEVSYFFVAVVAVPDRRRMYGKPYDHASGIYCMCMQSITLLSLNRKLIKMCMYVCL